MTLELFKLLLLDIKVKLNKQIEQILFDAIWTWSNIAGLDVFISVFWYQVTKQNQG